MIGPVLLVHLAATLALAGLIWFVQLVHYPLMRWVGPQAFVEYQASHTRRTGLLAGALMALEGTTGLILLARPPAGVPALLPRLGCLLLLVIWFSTALLQIPRHRALARGFDAGVHRTLVSTNWIRTVAWSLRGFLVLRMIASSWGRPA